MILITWGLLTLLAFSNAGGDHIKGGSHIIDDHIKGGSHIIGDHIKGGSHIKRASVLSAGIKSVPQALIQQEEVAPAVITKTSVPASVKTAPVEAITRKGAAPFGLKTAPVQHDISGKIHRTAELHQAADQPVAQVPVIQVADASDPGRVTGLKTVSSSVPAVGKTTAINTQAPFLAESVKGLKTVASATRGKTRFSVSEAQIRGPLAKSVVDQTAVTAVKTSPFIPQRTIKSAIQPGTILTQQKITPAITKGGSDVLAEAMRVPPLQFVGEGMPAELAGIGEKRKVVISTPLISNQELSADIKLLNRQLMETQTEEELKRTFAGIVNADSDLGAITLSEADLNDLSMRVGANAMRPQGRPLIPAPQQMPLSRNQGVRQRIPAPLNPQIISGGEAAVSGYDQRIRYTGNRLTTGPQGSARQIIPGQAIGGATVIQGENMQFVSGNSAGSFQPGSQTAAIPKRRVLPQVGPKPQTAAPALQRPQDPAPLLPQPGLSTDIVELNRQLMQKQSKEEIKRTLGIVQTDSNLGAITLSEAEIADLSRRVGADAPKPAVPAPQQRRPEQLPRPAVPAAPQRRPVAPGPQERRPVAVRQRIPAAPKPQVIGGAAGGVSGFDQRIRYTGPRVTSGVQGSVRRIIPGQAIGGTSVIQGENLQFVLGNTAGNIQPGGQGVSAPKPRVSAQAIPKPQRPAPAQPRPLAPSPILPQSGLSTDVVELNRQLMQKQSEKEIKRTLGIVRTDSNLGAITLSEAEIADLSRRVGADAPKPAAQAPQQRRPDQLPRPAVPAAPQRRPVAPGPQERRPVTVTQRIPAAPKPQVFGGAVGGVSGFDQRIRYTGSRVTSGVQGSVRQIFPGQAIGGTSVVQGENLQFVLGNAAGITQPGGQGLTAPNPRVSAQAIPKSQVFEPARSKPQAPILPQSGLSTDVVELNRQLMQKQSEEEIKRTLGIVRTDSNLGAITLSEAEIADLSRRVGADAPKPAAPALQQRRPEQLPRPVVPAAPQRRPAAPGPQQRRPVAVRKRIPAAPKSQVISGAAGGVSGFDQRIRYTGPRVTSGVQGSVRRIIPGQAIGGTSVIQGENLQFVLGNTAGNIQPGGQGVSAPKPRVSAQAIPKPQRPAPAQPRPLAPSPILPQSGLSTDVVELNRQLMQKQSEEEIKRTLGIVQTDSNIGAITLSEAEIADITRRVGADAPKPAAKAPQLRRPEQLPRPSVPLAPQRRPAAPGPQQRRPVAVRQRIPAAPKLEVIGGAAGGLRGFDQRIRYTGSQVTSGVQGSVRRIIPGQAIGGTSVIQGENLQFVLGNTAGNIQPGGQGVSAPKPQVSAQAIRKPQRPAPVQPKPLAPSPILPQSGLSTDVVELNRQLMQKQSEEEIKRTLGIVRTDSNLGAITLSEAEIADLSRRVGADAPKPAAPALQQRRPEQLPRPVVSAAPQRRPAAPGPQQRRPVAVRQRIPAAPKPQVIGGAAGGVSGFDQRIRYTGTRVTSGVQGSVRRIIPGQAIGGTSVIQGENLQFVLGNTAGNIQPGGQRVSAPKPRVSAQAIPKPQRPAPAQPRPLAPSPILPQSGLSTDVVKLNRQLMQKQSEEEIKRTLGIVRTDSNLGAITLSEAEITDITRRVGADAPKLASPAPQQRRPEQLPRPVVPAAQQRRPVAPGPQERRPVAVRQRKPAAPKPQVFGGAVGGMSGFDQRIRYTGSRVTSGVQGSVRRIIPGQTIGGTSVIQGENLQFVLGNAAGNIQPGGQGLTAPNPRVSAQAIPKSQVFEPARPKPQAPILPQSGLSTDVVELNRQLMQKQSEEEIKRTLGIVQTDSNIGAITLSEAEIADITRRVGADAPKPAAKAPQLRRPEQLPRPSVPLAPQRRPAAPGPQQRRPVAVRQRIPAAPKLEVIGGAAGGLRGFDQRKRYTGSQVTSGVQGSVRRIIPGQAIGGTSVIQGENLQFVLGNTAGNIQPGGQGVSAPKPQVSAQAIRKPQRPAPVQPKPLAPSPILPQSGLSTDVVELNRQLMQKQSEEEIKRTLGIVRTDSNLGAITLSEAEIADLSRRVGADAPKPAAPALQQRRPEQLPRPVVSAAPQRRPAAPGPQQRRPVAVRQRIPAAPKPQVIGGAAGGVSGFDQRIRYTGTRVTSGVQGSVRRIIPGQAIGGTSVIQGENLQFVLGNTAGNIQPGGQRVSAPKPRVSAQAIPKPQRPAPAQPRPLAPSPILPQSGLSTDVVDLNRQLMQKQSEEEIKRTLGIVPTDSNLGAITLSEAEITDITRRVGADAPKLASPAPQQRRPEQLPRPVVPAAQQRRPVAPGPQERRPVAVRQRKPAAPKPQVFGGAVGGMSGFDQRIRYTGSRVTSGVQGSVRRIIPGQTIGGTSVIQGENLQFVLGNAAGNIQPGGQGLTAPNPRVSAQAIPKSQVFEPARPKPQAPILPQSGLSTDVVELNRQLMQKQSEEEIKRTLGIVRTDSNLGAITLSEAEIADLSRRVGADAPKPAAPALQQRRPEQLPRPVVPAAPQRRPAAPGPQQRRPVAVRQRIPAAPKPQVIGGAAGGVSGFDQRIRYTGSRVTSGVQGSVRRIIPGQTIGGTSVIQGENLQFVLGNAAGNIQPGGQGLTAPNPRVSAQAISKSQVFEPARPKPQAPILPQPDLSTDIVELNRQFMEKQSEEEIKRTLTGIVRADSDLGAITLSEAELADLSRRVGSDVPKPAAPAPQQRRPQQLPKPAVPAVSQRRPEAVRERITAFPIPQIVRGGAGAVSGFDQTIRYTGSRLSPSGLQGYSRRIVPGQQIGGTSVIQGEKYQFVVGNSAGTVGEILPGSQRPAAPRPRVSPQALPKPQISTPALAQLEGSAPILSEPGLSSDIIELNRQLMQKQNEEELRQAFSGFLKADTDFNKISLSADELSEISRSLSGRVSGSLSSESVIPVPYMGGMVESQRSPTGSSRDALFQRYGSGSRSSISTGSRTSNAQSAINAASKMQVMSQVQQKVSQESIEAPLQLQQNIEPTLAVAQVEEPVVQTKVTQTVKAFNAPISQTVQRMLDTSDSSQLQMKFDDVIEQSQLSKPVVVEQMQLKRNIDLPSRKSKMALDNLSQKYLQEKLPVEIPSYVPLPSFMSPFNYRVPHLRSPIVQQQERLDQILV